MRDHPISQDGVLLSDAKRGILAYVCLTLLIVFAFILIQSVDWVGDAALHSMMEVGATLLAAFVGLTAIARLSAEKNSLYLLLGVGFFGTALLDGYHMIVTSPMLDLFMPSPPASLAPWSWNASRTFLAILTFGSWLAWRREARLGESGRINERFLYVSVGLLTLVSFCFFAFVPLPRAYYPELFFGRPEEFVAAAFFLAAFIGFVHKGEWRTDSFEFWLTMSLLVGVLSQALVMSRSFELHDVNFVLAHFLKIVSYVLVLIGLFANIFRLYQSKERDEKWMRAILKTAQDGIVTIDQAGTIETFNLAAEEMFGYEFSEVQGENIKLLMPAPYRNEHDGYLFNYLETRIPKIIGSSREVFGRKKNGKVFPIELAISEVTVGGQIRYSGMIRDISERKRQEEMLRSSQHRLAQHAEQLTASNADLEQFASIASHDLQEPLRKISAFCQLLKAKHGPSLDDEANSFIDFAVDGASRMKALVSDLLEFSRAGQQAKEIVPIDPGKMYVEVITNLEFVIAESNAQVTCDVLPMAMGDRFGMVQLFQNLIGNALKYRHPDRAPVVHVGSKTQDEWHVFFVRDNGIGIGKDYYDKVFEIFQRLHGPTEFSGTGIGLAITKKIVDKMGGKIWVESEEGRGTTFFFSLARVEENTTENAEHSQETDLTNIW